MVVDFHTHVFPPWVREERSSYVTSDRCFALLYSNEKARLATCEELIADMDSHGVGFAVVSNITWMSTDMCRRTNDYLLEMASHYPRLLPFCGLYPGDTRGAILEMERCARSGAKGFGELRVDMASDRPTLDLFVPLFEVGASLGLPLLIHASEPVGHSYAGKGSATPEFLLPLLAARQGAEVVLAHWGGGLPFYTLMSEVDRVLEGVFFDSAASPLLYRPQIYVAVTSLVGAERVLFGSDYPLIGYKRPLADIDNAGLSEEARRLILGDNARRLLGL